MARKNSRATRQKDKLRKQQSRSQVQQTFLYLPGDNIWRNEQYIRLQILSELPTMFEQTLQPLPLVPPSRIYPIRGDGNCLFNALSFILTGTEEYNFCIRSHICAFMRSSPGQILPILPLSANQNVNSYFQQTHMERSGIWGTEVEIMAAATLLQTNIFVYSKSGVHWKWIKYSPYSLTVDHGIYLYHKNGNHFDVVVAIENSNNLCDLNETDYYCHDKTNKYQNNSTFREKQKQYSRKSVKKRYHQDDRFRKTKKECQKNKYKCDDRYRLKQCQSQRERYRQNKIYRERKRQAAKKRYWNNSVYRQQSKLKSVQRYCCSSKFRNRLREMSKKKYLSDIKYQRKKKDSSRQKYAFNSDHQNRVKENSKRKYAFDSDHQERVKNYSKRKYAFDSDHQVRVKNYSKRKYACDSDHQEKVKKYSKTKYAENDGHRLRVRQYSRSKYQRFASFRNHVKVSSVKKYATNPLFRCALKGYLRNQYHKSSKIQQGKKKRVNVARQSIKKSIAHFKRNVSSTPSYICLICIRLLYRSQVKECKKENYSVKGVLNDQATKCFSESFSHNCMEKKCPDTCWIKLSNTDKQWICHTCDRHLKHGSMPPQAQANNLTLVPIPPELSKLNELERQLIALRIAFMKLLSLPRGGQKGVKGPVVNVPSDLTSITSSLPRNLNDAQLIKVKLKRKLEYKGHYSYKWITPDNVIQALKILKNINIWFSHITIDECWLNKNNDIDLIQQDDCENDSDTDEENDEDINNLNMPIETCFQPVDIGQEILDTNSTLCIAPAENEKPQNIFLEKGSDAMAFPTLLPDGHFGLFEDREIKLSPSKYFNARLFSADSRFSTNKEYIFFAQYVTEIQQISSNISLALRKGQPTTQNGQPVTAAMLLNADHANDILKSDIGYRFLQPVRGTPPYWQRTMKDLYAMIHQLGIPTWFVTFSAAETRWKEVIETLLFLKNDNRQVKDMDWSEKCALITDNPVACSRLFDHRVKCLFTDLIMSQSCPVGKVVDYFFRTEFQQRGSPHIHCLLWIKDAPKFNENTDQEVCQFIDKYITCKMPNYDDDPELHDIISSVQVHSKTHSKSCKKHSSTCRFNFPRPPVQTTFIARSESTEKQEQSFHVPTVKELDEMSRASAKTPKQILRDVWKLVSAADETNYSFSKILQLVNITYSQFQQCLVDVATRNTVHLKRNMPDIWVNNYNENLSRAWNANLDIQYVTDAYACVAYILSYISKSETELGDLIQNAQQEADEGNMDAASAMRKIGNIYVQNREVSAQEAVYRVCGLHLKECTRDVVFIPAGSHIFKMSLPISLIKSRFSAGSDNEQDIWMSSVHDKYYARPDTDEFNTMSLAEFSSKFRFIPKSQNPKSTPLLPVFQLKNGLGQIKKRKSGKEAVIRYPRFNASKNSDDYFLSLAQLYLPHRSPISLPEGFESFEVYVKNGVIENCPILTTIERNRHQFEKDAESLEKAWADLQEGKIPDESWGAIDPENEVERIEIQMDDNDDQLEEQEEIPELVYENQLNQDKHTFHYEPPKSSQKDIQEAIRSMNDTQQQVFYKIRDWCNQLVWGNSPEPFHVFLTGGAGTGKSHLIRCIFHEMSRILSKSTSSPDSISILLTAPTGTAAFNIQGMTIHSAFAINKNIKLPYQPLGENLLNTLRSKFDALQLLIIDEISMVDQKILTYVHGRLAQIKHCKKPFGNVCILAVGDFYQLPPVRGLALYKKRDSNFMDLWNTKFFIVTLTEIMRQKDDSDFALMLNRLRIHLRGNPLTETDKKSLKNVTVKETPPDKAQILHIFPTNKEVDSHNSKMINETCNPVFTSMAMDFYTNVVSGKLCQKDQPYATCAPEDLQTAIKIGVGARVMLTRNIDTEDGLVNGAFGTVTALDFNNGKHIKGVNIKFDNQKVGQKNANKSAANPNVAGSVYIKHFQDTLSGKKVTRKQFPLKLAWAATIHKVQGMTVDQVVVSLKKIFQAGMAYVALSRATSLSGLYILDFNADSIYSSDDITEALQGMPQYLPLEPSSFAANTLTIISHNTEGLLPHLKDIMSINRFNNAHVVCFTETWLTPDQTVTSSLLPDHQSYHCYRNKAYNSTHPVYATLGTQNRGGVAMFVKEVDHETLPLHFTNLEAVALKVQNICFVLVYRPPSYNLQLFTDNIKQILVELQQLQIPSIILGDFNTNALQAGTNLLQKSFEDFGYSQLVSFQTTEAGTCLDLVFVQGFPKNPDVSVLPTYYSFHDAVQICLPMNNI